MFSQTLVQGLNGLPDRPWREKRHGKGITVAWLAEQLQPYGIYPAMMRIGAAQARGYFEADFQEAFQRYMSRSDMDALRASLHPPSSDFGAASPPSSDSGLPDVSARQAGEASPPSSGTGATSQPSSDSGGTRDKEQKKDEPGEAQGGEAAAA